MKPLEGYQLEREGSHAVALELELDDELRREGLAREVVHAVQNARKAAGLEVEDRIELRLGGDDELLDAAREHADYVKGETLALELAFDGDSHGDDGDDRGQEAGSASAGREEPAPRGGRNLRERQLRGSASKRFLGMAPWIALGLLAVAEEDHGGDRQDLVVRGGLLVLVDVELDDARVLTPSAISSRTGATTRHGPHQGAQKSTSTGCSFSSTSAWKSPSVTCLMSAIVG